ncbi:hypothetical protein SAMN04487967_2183 [Natronorubrum sediminis]|uniref:Uncharacterized protein n=1 Tax=Natronorubrum sediminis TaxID=640943 RepID=A0A1H6G055_9EURY|nr:hypothetical protein [Natronorubrum sediminis]SEH15663.1 hypothetical protein SAMN04487967_2183 [Natronorubrum sediminis]
MATLMWTIWLVGTLLSLSTIYVLLRVLYDADNFDDDSAAGGQS